MISQLNQWISERFPTREIWRHTMTEYYAPKNLNFWYVFGVFSLVVLVNQILTGIWLSMYYTPTAKEAFDSVEHVMRNVKLGWLLRYLHSTGASAMFVVVYLHMYRALIYGSYRKPRELLWIVGALIYVALMAEAFTGYTLPWGQMSYWATRVITSLFSGIPLIGETLRVWLQGDYVVSGITLHRFFTFHIAVIPMGILILVLLHLMALRTVGSNNPDGIEIKKNLNGKGVPVDGIPFHPYFTVKDLFAVVIFFIIFLTIVFYFPTFGGQFLEPENFIQANPMRTPAHIAPVWYLAPFYAILRAVPNKILGIWSMAASVAVLFILPWLDRSPVKSLRYKGVWSKVGIVVFVICFIGLGYLGALPPTPLRTMMARVFTIMYTLFFVLMPFYTYYESCKRAPERVRLS